MGRGLVEPLETSHFPHGLPCQIWYHSCQSNGTSTHVKIYPKIGPSGPAFQVYSRSLKVTQIDWVLYDFLLVIHTNYGPLSSHFRDKRRFRLKMQILCI